MRERLENTLKGGEGTRRRRRGTIKRSYSIRCVFKFDRKEKKLNRRRIKRNNGRGKATFSVDTELKGEGIKEVQEVMAGRARETDGEEAAGEA